MQVCTVLGKNGDDIDLDNRRRSECETGEWNTSRPDRETISTHEGTFGIAWKDETYQKGPIGNSDLRREKN